MSHHPRITLFKYEVYLTQDNMLEVESSLLDKEDWDNVVSSSKEMVEYEDSVMVSNFLGYLKKLMVSINSGVTTYF
tara:strand:+ start:440 stop:667 length:228 start_codon:yes stop_codon:yes gene_type:complete